MEYEYTKEDRITTPHLYMYTPYQGRDFLDSFLNNRNECVGKLNTAGIGISKDTEFVLLLPGLISRGIPAHFSPLCKKVVALIKEKASIKEFHDVEFITSYGSIGQINNMTEISAAGVTAWKNSLMTEENISLPLMLKDCIALLCRCDTEAVQEIADCLSLFQKKYEVFKRLFTQYDKKQRKIGEDYADLSPYALMALGLGILYIRTGDLNFLSTQLKVNDLICSVADRAAVSVDALPTLFSLYFEIASVEELMQRRGVL